MLTVAFTWRLWPVFAVGGLYMEVVPCIWRRWPILVHRGFYVEAVACTLRWLSVLGGAGPVLVYSSFYVEAVACTWRWLRLLGGGGLYLLTVACTWRRRPVREGGGLYVEAVACTQRPLTQSEESKWPPVPARPPGSGHVSVQTHSRAVYSLANCHVQFTSPCVQFHRGWTNFILSDNNVKL